VTQQVSTVIVFAIEQVFKYPVNRNDNGIILKVLLKFTTNLDKLVGGILFKLMALL